jgi:hypothetical protein
VIFVSEDFPTFAEVGEENIRARKKAEFLRSTETAEGTPIVQQHERV